MKIKQIKAGKKARHKKQIARAIKHYGRVYGGFVVLSDAIELSQDLSKLFLPEDEDGKDQGRD